MQLTGTDDSLKKLKRKAALVSLVIGTPTCLLLIFSTFLYPETTSIRGFGALFLIYALAYRVVAFGFALAGLLISSLLATWFAGKRVADDLLQGKKLILVSFRYTLFVNSAMGITFIAFTVISNVNSAAQILGTMAFFATLLASVLVCFMVSVVITPLTIGLLVSYTISALIKKSKDETILGSTPQQE